MISRICLELDDRPRLRGVVGGRAVSTIVARVRPRTSKGITDIALETGLMYNIVGWIEFQETGC